VNTNNTPYYFYSKDNAGKLRRSQRDNPPINDRTSRGDASSIPHFQRDWTNQDVTLECPFLT
jgi:hypothetical protein